MKRLFKVMYRLTVWSIIYAAICGVVAAFATQRHPHGLLILWVSAMWLLNPAYLALGFMLGLWTFLSYGATPAPPGTMSHSPSMFDSDSHGVNSLGEPTRNGISIVSGLPMGMESTSAFDD